MALVERRTGTLHVEAVSLTDIAEQFGTPCYVYSRKALTEAYNAYCEALAKHNALICYAVKANSNLAVLSLFARLGAGFDIVSGGELARVLAAGGEAKKVVFSGVGKSHGEIVNALRLSIKCFNIESAAELDRINAVAGDLGLKAPISFRVNPNVDPKTHPYISTGLKTSKFGIAYEEALPLYRRAAALPHIHITGIDCHIGSQLLDPAPATEAAQKVLALVDTLAGEGIELEHIDLGGGMGIHYRDEAVPSVTEYLAPILRVLHGRKEQLLVEPGRSLVGNAGLLLTRVEILKHGSAHDFAIVDAAMNDLMRPALYDAWHDIVAVSERNELPRSCEVVGPVCESGDFLGHERMLAVHEGDLLAVMSAGAYGMAMSSNYNSRPRAAEVMVDGAQAHLVRKREEITQLFAGESTLP
ncbi:Diaminopimelate decarboxylase [Georgfuchsia toluolica]|uniref:Diaminopimelate decarboxylase n=1 Tax=Georgfuchsia toluolica TaxID=424218 RepID=A0A916J9Q3_9PROT|nr:diaminopimelate decarboxylase [Georgfuchsia toluolica]CAG4884948.1 Diaminopimelate decarboxylase [Georgfuchsia toluolica]